MDTSTYAEVAMERLENSEIEYYSEIRYEDLLETLKKYFKQEYAKKVDEISLQVDLEDRDRMKPNEYYQDKVVELKHYMMLLVDEVALNELY